MSYNGNIEGTHDESEISNQDFVGHLLHLSSVQPRLFFLVSPDCRMYNSHVPGEYRIGFAHDFMIILLFEILSDLRPDQPVRKMPQ